MSRSQSMYIAAHNATMDCVIIFIEGGVPRWLRFVLIHSPRLIRFPHVKALCVACWDWTLTVANKKSDLDSATLGVPTSWVAFDVAFVSDDEIDDTFSKLA